jgi:hypothetical protein
MLIYVTLLQKESLFQWALCRGRKDKKVGEKNENLFSFPSLNRNFALSFSLGENRLHLRKSKKNLVFRSVCTIFSLSEKILPFENTQINLVFCSLIRIFAA